MSSTGAGQAPPPRTKARNTSTSRQSASRARLRTILCAFTISGASVRRRYEKLRPSEDFYQFLSDPPSQIVLFSCSKAHQRCAFFQPNGKTVLLTSKFRINVALWTGWRSEATMSCHVNEADRTACTSNSARVIALARASKAQIFRLTFQIRVHDPKRV